MKIFVVETAMTREEILSSYDGYIFDPEYVVDEEQVMFAYYLMKRAFERGKNIADDPKIEFLVRLSGRNQISEALKLGLKDKMKKIGVLMPKAQGITSINGREEKIKKFYGTTNKKKIFEKMAMVEIL